MEERNKRNERRLGWQNARENRRKGAAGYSNHLHSDSHSRLGVIDNAWILRAPVLPCRARSKDDAAGSDGGGHAIDNRGECEDTKKMLGSIRSRSQSCQGMRSITIEIAFYIPCGLIGAAAFHTRASYSCSAVL